MPYYLSEQNFFPLDGGRLRWGCMSLQYSTAVGFFPSAPHCFFAFPLSWPSPARGEGLKPVRTVVSIVTCIELTLLCHIYPFARLPFNRRGELELRNRYRLQTLFDRSQNFVRRDRNFMDSHSDRVVDSVGNRGNDRKKRSLTSFFGAIGSFRIVGFNEDRFDLWCLKGCGTLIFQYRRYLMQPIFAENLLLHQRFA